MTIPEQFLPIIDLYRFEPWDALTVKHINEHLQATFPGKYRVYVDLADKLQIKYEFDTPEEYTWWVLKYL